MELAATVANKLLEKHHRILNDELLSLDYASSHLDPEGAWQAPLCVSWDRSKRSKGRVIDRETLGKLGARLKPDGHR